MSGGAFELSLLRLAPFPRVLLLTVHRESCRCGLGLLRHTEYPRVPFRSFSIFCIICTCLRTVAGIFVNLVDVLHLRNLCGVHHFGILYLLHRWHKALRIDRVIFHSCCCSTVSARLECCELGFASHLIYLLLDDRILSLRGVLDDLGMIHIHCDRECPTG